MLSHRVCQSFQSHDGSVERGCKDYLAGIPKCTGCWCPVMRCRREIRPSVLELHKKGTNYKDSAPICVVR
ncbi:hypothetical protein Y032_0005g2366 [Ancylostoma ceylanicum]|uniref:Uncharacterized protein n=1 Tax=Ancylostoma ceylanicum TaxID=53326 RepID=A0A016VRN2_9BILA|nr:hypothetical protein Y032_0005g2366 [Ancylostoma ceylanicum]